jgi:hypothetical protein
MADARAGRSAVGFRGSLGFTWFTSMNFSAHVRNLHGWRVSWSHVGDAKDGTQIPGRRGSGVCRSVSVASRLVGDAPTSADGTRTAPRHVMPGQRTVELNAS